MTRPRNERLNAYRFMWLIAMFDLPVGTKQERRAATGFRNWLLDEGYEMSQFSVYIRFCVGKEQMERRLRAIAMNVPPSGKVHVLSVTDRQFEQMAVFRGKSRTKGSSASGQLVLF